MKKLFYILVAIVMVLFGGMNVAACETTDYYQVDGTIIYAADDIDETFVSSVIMGWVSLPDEVKSALVQYGVQIVITDEMEDVSETSVYYNVGKTSRTFTLAQAPVIYIMDAEGVDGYALVAHNAGHMFEKVVVLSSYEVFPDTFTVVSGTDTWQELYAANYDALSNIDNTAEREMAEGCEEAFADSFRLYCQAPEALYEAAPDVYNFISSIVEMYC